MVTSFGEPVTNRKSQFEDIDSPAFASSDFAGPVEKTRSHHSSQARADAQAALKAMAVSGDMDQSGRFAALDDGLMARIDRATTREISRVHTREIEPPLPEADTQ